MRCVPFCLAVVVLALVAGPSFAQVTSGPAAGAGVAVCKVQALGENTVYKEVELAKERADKPTVYVFVQAEHFDRPMFRYMKKLAETIKELNADARVVAVWLTEDRDKTREYLPKIARYFEGATLAYFDGEKAGPADWSLNGDARLTAVVANKTKVVSSFGYASLNDTDVPAVEKALKDALDKK